MFKRILMNAADTSPGNAAPVVVPPASDAPVQAQGTTVTLSQADLDAKIASALEQGFAKARDSFHAEARRASEAQKPKPKNDTAAPAAPDLNRLRKLDRAISTEGVKLTEFAYELAEKEWSAAGDVDAGQWVKDFSARLGINTAPAVPPASNTTPALPKSNPTGPTASDRGAPPPPQVPLIEADLITMSETDRAALRKEKGDRWFTTQLAKQLKGRPITLR